MAIAATGCTPVSSVTSEAGTLVAGWLGLASLATAAGIALQVLIMRLRARRRAFRAQALVAAWQPVMTCLALGDVSRVHLPSLHPRDRADVMQMWLRLQEGLRGSACESLKRWADALGFHDGALRWARQPGGGMAERALGMLVLGHLGRPEDAGLLRTALAEPLPLVSLGAARALLQIDAAAFVPLVLDEYLRRPDWPMPRMGTLLREAGAPAVAEPLVSRLLNGTTPDQKRLLPLLRFAESPCGGGALHRVVERSRDPQVLSLALRQLCGPEPIGRVRELAGHPDPLVRSAAAQALGQMGMADERGRLEKLMSDGNWWVRYRAAQAQLKLPGTDAAAVVALRGRLGDRFARDALDHACAELALRGQSCLTTSAPS